MTEAPSERRLMSSGQVARRLGISASRVARLVEAGSLRYIAKTPAGRVFDPTHVEDVARARAEAARSDWRMRVPMTPNESTPLGPVAPTHRQRAEAER